MNEKELKAITDSIESKLGKENSAIISDDLGKLITGNTNNLNSLKSKDDEIANLKTTNEKLVMANGSLLQQVPMASDYDKHQSNDEDKDKKQSFNFMSVFDEKGHFRKK